MPESLTPELAFLTYCRLRNKRDERLMKVREQYDAEIEAALVEFGRALGKLSQEVFDAGLVDSGTYPWHDKKVYDRVYEESSNV